MNLKNNQCLCLYVRCWNPVPTRQHAFCEDCWGKIAAEGAEGRYRRTLHHTKIPGGSYRYAVRRCVDMLSRTR